MNRIIVLALTTLLSTMAYSNPTAKAVLSIPGSTYKVSGHFKFNRSFTVSTSTLYTAKIMGGVKINYDLTHSNLTINFQCNKTYENDCGEGAIITVMGQDIPVKKVIYSRANQSFRVIADSWFQNTINTQASRELNRQLKSKMDWGLDRLKQLVNQRVTDPVIIAEAISTFIEKVKAGSPAGQTIHMPGFSASTLFTITPGRDAIVKVNDLFLHFKRRQPAKFDLHYRRSAAGVLAYTHVNAYFQLYPANGLTVSTRADGKGMKAKINNIFLNARNGLSINTSTAIDNDINTSAYLIGALVTLSGGPRVDPNCCRTQMVAETIERITIRQTKSYVRMFYQSLLRQNYPRNLLDAILRQPL